MEEKKRIPYCLVLLQKSHHENILLEVGRGLVLHKKLIVNTHTLLKHLFNPILSFKVKVHLCLQFTISMVTFSTENED